MSSLRVARTALRAGNVCMRPALLAQRRGYADVASDKIQLSLSLPHQAVYKSTDCVQVNIAAESGEMGVLAQHVPSIEQLKPGLVEIIEEAGGSKQFFRKAPSSEKLNWKLKKLAVVSGGFAVISANSKLHINAVEGYPLEDFSAEAVRSQIAEAQKIASGGGSERDVAEARIELEVLESLQAALK